MLERVGERCIALGQPLRVEQAEVEACALDVADRPALDIPAAGAAEAFHGDKAPVPGLGRRSRRGCGFGRRIMQDGVLVDAAVYGTRFHAHDEGRLGAAERGDRCHVSRACRGVGHRLQRPALRGLVEIGHARGHAAVLVERRAERGAVRQRERAGLADERRLEGTRDHRTSDRVVGHRDGLGSLAHTGRHGIRAIDEPGQHSLLVGGIGGTGLELGADVIAVQRDLEGAIVVDRGRHADVDQRIAAGHIIGLRRKQLDGWRDARVIVSASAARRKAD
ncbi:hypothetical protein D3C85_980560 [compost metagenome]